MAGRYVDPASEMRRLAVLCGVLAGLGGIIHVVGEVRQGDASPEGVVFDSWADGRIAANLGGEPAMTVLPTTADAGIATYESPELVPR